MIVSRIAKLFLAFTSLYFTAGSPLRPRATCTKTQVAVLGAGVAGIAAAEALHNASISDFIVIDVNDYIGGRLHHTTFGKNPATGQPYTIEFGANWVQGLGKPGGPQNPIWTLANKWGLNTTYSNYSAIQTYDQTGPVDYVGLLDEYETAYGSVEKDAGQILTQNLQDRTMRAGLSFADWKTKDNMHKQAAEWWEFDWEYAWPPEQSSETFTVINFNDSFYQFSEDNNLCTDPRGFNYWLKQEASTFLTHNDPRLLLSTNVTSIDYSAKDTVTINTSSGTCIEASYAIVTFSLGVLQNDVVSFNPPLPAWKQSGIDGMQMGTYTKIFFQFPPDSDGKFFWEKGANPDTQFFLYADHYERGYYPVWQSLSAPGFYPGSGIIFVTVTAAQAYRAENQDDTTVKNEALDVLRSMFGKDNVPGPIDFVYPRWTKTPWSYGSYSNWPPGYSLEMHQNLRANLGRMWFAGEATSVSYFGFLQGAYNEGQYVGEQVTQCVDKKLFSCDDEPHYENLKGDTTSKRVLQEKNGWLVDSTQV
ncbi:related to amine oxidase [Phialocephala subalpina]|uniref:Amine oxidase n=1 Tax=Phialocephala subalpina TaxID=576137 RepID=A0A1L7WPX6_9HELO|nr:related to amine oxidase [Phialocephala subalpina]